MNTELSPQTAMTRRRFLYCSALTASVAALSGCSTPKAHRLNAGDKLRIAAVGGGGKGSSDIECCGGEQIVAIADVDKAKAEKESLSKYPNAKFYYDWREMFDKEGKNFDAVTVSTP